MFRCWWEYGNPELKSGFVFSGFGMLYLSLYDVVY